MQFWQQFIRALGYIEYIVLLSDTLYFYLVYYDHDWIDSIDCFYEMQCMTVLHKYFRELRLFSANLIYRKNSLAYCFLQILFYLKIQKEVYTGAIFHICWVCNDNNLPTVFVWTKKRSITGTIIHIIQEIFSPRRSTSKVIIIQTFGGILWVSNRYYRYYQLFTFFENLVQHVRLEQQAGTLWPFNGIR